MKLEYDIRLGALAATVPNPKLLLAEVSDKMFLGPRQAQRGAAMHKLHRCVREAGGNIPVSSLKHLYDNNPWMKGAVGDLATFCAEGPLMFIAKDAGKPAALWDTTSRPNHGAELRDTIAEPTRASKQGRRSLPQRPNTHSPKRHDGKRWSYMCRWANAPDRSAAASTNAESTAVSCQLAAKSEAVADDTMPRQRRTSPTRPEWNETRCQCSPCGVEAGAGLQDVSENLPTCKPGLGSDGTPADACVDAGEPLAYDENANPEQGEC